MNHKIKKEKNICDGCHEEKKSKFYKFGYFLACSNNCLEKVQEYAGVWSLV
ncbi:hypothetical protein [Mycoplasma tauri]|uniref:hypothetical protein n=1 Tax=Mycoplasma tauri TaxID=547987 RepID=UPI001CBFF22C|nr:hypothetical protein [Mycoplasma tauri]MBZ4203395.1 hypothetical protein [Mycoplasma tauri]MBZ4204466.1 hypothetical protein [Mycoplasma tauri]MBZ4226752.1 hypothetical protein [Mycoplasma tauri]